MKELLKQLAAYNTWATQRMAEAILTVPEEKQTAVLPSSYESLQRTLLHMWDAESIWWQRMKLHERFVRPSDNFNGTTRDVVNGLLSQSKLWEGWVNAASDYSLDHVFEYRDNKREQVKMPIYQMLLHVFNHGTYHRGQLVNMLRQLGVEKIPGTDFALWIRARRV
ncbi:MAG: DinB family protein [Chitinophagales bacterium]|nr:DinB family protein [Chitinophagales bacterium]